MVAKATYKQKRLRETIAFGDFPAQPVGLPTQKFSLSVGGAKKHQQEDAKEKGAAEEEAALENRPKRERRKGALEQSLGTTAGPAAGGPTTEVKVTKHATNEPVLDLNSILRGKKVRVVTGEDDVAEAYSLVVRVLDKSKQQGFDLRSGIVAVVPKSHTMHAIVTALGITPASVR